MREKAGKARENLYFSAFYDKIYLAVCILTKRIHAMKFVGAADLRRNSIL